MRQIVIVDHPLIAEATAALFQKHLVEQLITVSPHEVEFTPPHALVFIELFLPELQCGLDLIRHLQQSRPDLTPIMWTVEPDPFYIWAATEYKAAGFLDKGMDLPQILYWLNHAVTHSAAWPGYLLDKARHWNQEAAIKLRSLTPSLWFLWAELFHPKTATELGADNGWSKRTVERRLSELYAALGVQSRTEAINIAWTWNLVTGTNHNLQLNKTALDMFMAK